MSSDYGEQYEGLLKPNKEFVRSDKSISSTTSRDLDFCFKVVLREAVKEDRLVKQVCHTMLSAYIKNPMNLAINAPTGEGKTHVLTTVGNLFPKTDVIYFVGMSSKAIFHKNGYIAVRDEDGKYIEVETELQQLKESIQLNKAELIRIRKTDSAPLDIIAELQKEIERYKQRTTEIEKNAVKVIDLNHKILVFLDTPSSEIFEALMPLLSHDQYEVEYQFVDTSNRTGLKTRTNVLRGWPSVIFAQAIDYTRHPRYQEIQRRFMVTNPKMDTEKYKSAVDSIIDKNCLPDLVYQQKVVSDGEKSKAKEIILNLKDDLLSDSSTIKPGKNNIHVPFIHLLKKLIPKSNTAQDMTFANRLLQHTRLLANIHSKERPYLEITPVFGSDSFHIPIAIYSDLSESWSLLNNNVGGIRPYVLDWYHKVFLTLYNSKSAPNSKEKNGELLIEERKAVTTQELIEKTNQVMKKRYTSKNILTEFIYPLFNLGYIDSLKSEIDRRSYIYFPVMDMSNEEQYTKNSKLFFLSNKNNLLEDNRNNDVNLAENRETTYIISEIDEVKRYYSENGNLVTLRFAHIDRDTSIEGEEEEEWSKTVEEIVDKYFPEFRVENGDDEKQNNDISNDK